MEENNQVLESTPPREGEYPHSWQLAMIIGSLCLGILLFGLDVNIIGTAIPRITTDFHSLSDVAWYGSAYLLTLTAFQPLFGNLYKYFNAKIVYLLSLLVFEVGSIICAAAPSSAVLIFGRALLGFGASGLLQGALAIIGYVVRLDKVPLFQGIVVSALGISVCIGPVIGGVLTEYTSWRWCFWINVPIGGVVILVVLVFVPLKQSSNQADRNFPLRDKLRYMDFVGTVLFIGTICCLLLALTWGGQVYAWKNSRIIGLFIGFGLLTACFCFWLWKRGEVALIPLRVLKKRSICMGALTLFGLGILSQVFAYYLPIFFQSVQGVSTTDSGVRYIALVVPQIVSLVVIGGLVSKWGYYVPYMIAGVIIMDIGAGFLTTISPTTPKVAWAAFLVVSGIGIGVAQQLPYTAVQAVLDPVDVPTGNAIAVFSFQLGGALGLAIAQNLLITRLRTAIPQYTSAVSPDQVIAAGATGLTSLASSPTVLQALRQAYSDSVHDVLILALAAGCLAFPSSCAMEWLNIKNIAAERMRMQQSEDEKDAPRERPTEIEVKVDKQDPERAKA